MKINGEHFQTIWIEEEDKPVVRIIDQRYLPHEFLVAELRTVNDVYFAIREMQVRGAPLIGVTAAFGMYIAAEEARKDHFGEDMSRFAEKIKSARPTAVDLEKAVDLQMEQVKMFRDMDLSRFLQVAKKLKVESLHSCKQIGQHGFSLIENIYKSKGNSVNILTHCNAGWLACIDYGTATAPIYKAYEAGIPVHVWVDETRPRNQGSRLTAFELGEHGVDHTVVVDNAGGHLMQHGKVDLVIVGTDRTTRTGDVCNKIGTYLKALAAKDNQVPFYVAAPSSSIDWSLRDGLVEIPIEERTEDEVKYIQGNTANGNTSVLLTPEKSRAANYAFDVTPARLVTGLITERGICDASEEGLVGLFGESSS